MVLPCVPSAGCALRIGTADSKSVYPSVCPSAVLMFRHSVMQSDTQLEADPGSQHFSVPSLVMTVQFTLQQVTMAEMGADV